MLMNINDDRMMREILSGQYLGVPDGHAIFMKYPLTGILEALYRILPNIDWYGHYLAAVAVLCLILTVYRVSTMVHEKKKRLIWMTASIGLCMFVFGNEFFLISFTTAAAVSGATAVFWYGTSKGKKSDVIITAILSVITWCTRESVFLMIVPMAGLIWLIKELPEKKKLWKKFVLPAAVFGSVGICMLIHQGMYSGEEWEKYFGFNQARSDIYDNSTNYYPNYDENREYYDHLGLTNEERRMMIYYDFTLLEDDWDAEEITKTFEKMQEIHDSYIGEQVSLKQTVIQESKAYTEHTLKGEYGVLYNIGVIGYLLLIGWLLYRRKWRQLIETLLFFGCGMGMFWVMQIRGRMPDRVIFSLSSLIFAAFVLNVLWNCKDFNKFMKSLFVCGMIGCTVIGVMNCINTVNDCQKRLENEKKFEELLAYCNSREDNFYFITGELLIEYGGIIGSPQKNDRANYISTGDWISYSPLERRKLEQEGIDSVADALLYDNNIYLIALKDAQNIKYIGDYLEFRSGREVTTELVDEFMDNYAVYRFVN